MKFKLYDRVRIYDTIGHIDAITNDRYRIKTENGYIWAYHYAVKSLEKTREEREHNKEKTYKWHSSPL